MDSSSQGIAGKLAALAAAALVMIPVFYILSIGPVARVSIQAGPGVSNRVKQFYLPVIWLHDNTPLKEPLEWYVELWGVR